MVTNLLDAVQPAARVVMAAASGSAYDFLTTDRICDNIITNPPFHSAESFVATALQQSHGKVALLLRLAFLEGGNRCRTIYRPYPPSKVWVFSERITFYPKGAQRAGSGTTAYAWFVWDRSHTGPTEINWLEPGYKDKYK